jgi:hypothetical protein
MTGSNGSKSPIALIDALRQELSLAGGMKAWWQA